MTLTRSSHKRLGVTCAFWVGARSCAMGSADAAGGRCLFGELAPAFVMVAEGAIEDIEGALFAEESARVASAHPKRKREYAAGRILARRAIAGLGGPEGAIGADSAGAPQWPAGLIGSITHSDAYAAAAVARTIDALGIGLDVEAVSRFHPGLEPRVLTPEEIATHLDGASPAIRQRRTAILFCAKEAFYKAQFALTGLRLGFRDVQVTLDFDASVFSAHRTCVDMLGLTGRFAVVGNLAAAALVIAADVSPAPLASPAWR
jgi:4'-phosphopantetheinyl transferase EntD